MKINTKIKEKLKGLYQANSGMTMIEILVAIAIIVVLMGVTMISLPRYRDSKTLEQASKDINDTLRQAQTLALSPNIPNAKYFVWEIKAGATDDEQCPDRQYIGVVADVEGAIEKKTCLDTKVNLQTDNIGALYFEVKTGNIFSDSALTVPANGKLTMEHTNHPGDSDLYFEININANTFSLGKEVVASDQSGIALACGNGKCEPEKGEKCGTCGDCACVCPTDGLQYCDQQGCPSTNWYDGSCHELPKPAATCGDGDKQPGEACDDGNREDGDYCSADCQTVLGQCGDGQLQGSEFCDDGDNNGKYGYCDTRCLAKLECGNTKIDSPTDRPAEICDDGNKLDGDYCSADCTKVTTVCGDNKIEGLEACDDGNKVDGDYCSADCLRETSVCGDGNPTGSEFCDEGTAINGQYNHCNTTCSAIIKCGDGICTTNKEDSWTCPIDCGQPQPNPSCVPNKKCTSNTNCPGGTCVNKKCNCTPVNPYLKPLGAVCDASSECLSNLCAKWSYQKTYTCMDYSYKTLCSYPSFFSCK